MSVLGAISGQVRLDIRQAVAAYAALRAQNARTVYALRGTGDSFVATGQVMAGAGLGLVAVFGKAVQAAAEFERKMDFFAAVSNTSAQSMANLSEYTLQLAEDTIYSASQIAEGFIELGKAGVSAEQIINGIGEAMANLGAAGDIPLAQSGQIITSTIQQFDLTARDAVEVTDLLAGAANASIADISDIGVSLKYVGGVANAVGLTFEDTTTAISLLAAAGIRGSTAGTSLRQMLVSLGGATEPAREVLKELGILLEDGTNKFFDQEGRAKSLAEVFQILQDHTADLTQKERLMALRTIFNNRALSAASILTREGAKGFRDMNAEMSKTTAADVARERLDNLSGDIEVLRGNIETLLIQAGSPFQEVLRGWVQQITRLVQAFGELDPGTQKMIVQMIGLGGAALVVMGAFTIVLGMIFRFLAAVLKLWAGLRLLWNIFKAVRVVMALGGIAILGTFGLIVAAVLAIVGALVLLYMKFEPFRNLVNGLGSAFMDNVVTPIVNGVKDLIGWFQQLDFSGMWDSIQDGARSAIDAVVGFFSGIGSSIGGAFSGALSAVGGFISGIVDWFQALPGRIMGIVTSFVDTVTELFTFRNIGFAIGFMVGTVVRLWIALGTRVGGVVRNVVTSIIGFFQALPGRVIGFVTTLVLGVVAWLARMGPRALALVGSMIDNVIGFFRSLPQRVVRFVAQMATRGIAMFERLAIGAARLAARTVDNVIDFLANLPGNVVRIFTRMASGALRLLTRWATNARTFAGRVYSNVVNGIQNLPSTVAGILGRVISAFTGVIRRAYDAARDFAGGLWKGFKAGLGMESPSFIEKAMWQITGTIDSETARLASQTARIQTMGKNLARTKIGVGGLDTRSLEATRRIGLDVAGASIAAPTARDRMAVQLEASRGPKQLQMVSGSVELHPNSKVFIRGVAEEITRDEDDYRGTLGRMGRR